LFSGAYIGIDPVSTGKPTRNFVGLERPPAVTADTAGRHFVLQAKSLGSLNIGSPVFFRKIKVGQVVKEDLDENGETATIHVFIHAPHDRKVLENTRFWNAGGIDFTIDASGIKVNTESIVTLMLGGISFDIPPTEQRGKIANENQVFMLYESRDNINEKVFQKRTRWLVYFDGSVRGLKPGAPVEFLGIKIGKVVDVRMEYQPGERKFRTPVIVEIEPERIITGDNIPQGNQRHKLMNELVSRGLRAQLKSGNVLTGQLFVEIAIHPQATPAEIDWKSYDYPAFPTIPQPLEGITSSVAEILTRLQKIPFEQIGQDLGATVGGAKQLVHSDELRASIRALEATLNETEQTMRSLHQMADYLERHPEAILKGKQQP
nr:MlaD family protein [Pseudomonadales bacterium]